jgi:hypothetical protein
MVKSRMTATLMEFQTKIVAPNKGFGARMAWLGAGVLVLALVLALVDGYERYALWTFGVAIALLIGGAVLARGDVNSRKLSADDLVISASEIRIGRVRYSVSAVQGIDFSMDGYEGMSDHHYYAGDAGVVDGMGNVLRFQSGGVWVNCFFFLAGQQDVRNLADLFREFYRQGIPFREVFRTQRTFLFEPVTDEEWEGKMIENGYR